VAYLRSFLIELLLLAALLFIPLFIAAPYILHVFIMLFYVAMLAVAWNILGGLTGQFSLGHAAFMAIGAYVSTLLLIKFNITPWIGMLAGGILAGVAAAIIFYPCFVLKGPYFALATIAFAETFRNLFTNWGMVGKAQGILLPMVDRSWYYFHFSNKLPYYYIALGLLLVIYGSFVILERSRLGYAFKCVREDEDTSNAIGINVVKHKLWAAFLSAAFTAVAGAFYAQYVRYVEPDLMLTNYSIEIVLPTIIGGIGTIGGPLLGAFVLMPISEYLRAMLGNVIPGGHLIVYSIVLIVIIRVKPLGLVDWLNGLKWYRRLNGTRFGTAETGKK
jgi:branched-chain amino acid transport system permease protein